MFLQACCKPALGMSSTLHDQVSWSMFSIDVNMHARKVNSVQQTYCVDCEDRHTWWLFIWIVDAKEGRDLMKAHKVC